MQKTAYQKPELRDANDTIIQEGAFGKNTALSNSTNDGWIDYVMNDLEALHDVVGETSPTLDANGHVVEPANLAIGDEDGNRIKDSYLKLSGGKVTGITSFRTDLRMLDNQDNRWGGLYVPGTTATEQYLSLYGGTRATGDARLNLYSVGNGKFELTGYSTDGANAYTLTHDNSGNLNWRGYPLAWKKDYLALSGGTMTGNVLLSNNNAFRMVVGTHANGRIGYFGGTGNHSAGIQFYGPSWSDTSSAGIFSIRASTKTSFEDTDPTHKSIDLVGKPNGSLTWGNKELATQEFVNNKVKSVKLTSTFNFDFTGKNGWIGQDTDGNNLHFTLPTGVTEVLAFSLVSSGTWTRIVAWYVNNSSINFSLESHHPNAAYSGTTTVYCYLLYR